MPTVFYYGLYMDDDVRDRVAAKGEHIAIARLDDWALRLGGRSTLERADGGVVWGVVAETTEDQLARLYTTQWHTAYKPTEVQVCVGDQTRPAVVYVAPVDGDRPAEPNHARALAALCRKLGFPEDYAAKIH